MRKRNGLTLIEIIISVAILGILVVVFLNIFGMSNKNIFETNNETQILYEIQEQIDLKIEKIEGKNSFETYFESENEVIIEIKNVDAEITIENNDVEILTDEDLSGKLIIGTKKNVEISTFVIVPKELEGN